MLQDFFIGLGLAVLALWNFVMSFFQLLYISNMINGLSWFIGLIFVFGGIWPVTTTAECLIVIIGTYWFKYQIKFFMGTVWSMVPFVGRHVELPSMRNNDGTTSDIVSGTHRSNTLDLRKYRKVAKGTIDLRK